MAAHWRAGSGGTAGPVGGHGGPGEAERAGRSGPGGEVGAGQVGQDRAGPGRFSCERTHEWFLEMCVPSELARVTKYVINLDT